MWTELFLMNKSALISEMDSFIEHITLLRDYINNGDEEKIKEMMRLSTKRRSHFNK
jgi:prephenate dehydrogenase